MLSRGLQFGVFGAICFSLYALLGGVPPLMADTDLFAEGSSSYAYFFVARQLTFIAGCGLLFACVAAAVPALIAARAGPFGQVAAVLLTLAIVLAGLRFAGFWLPLPFPLPPAALALFAGSLFAFGLERLSNGRSLEFLREAPNPRPAALILAVLGAIMLLGATGAFAGSGGSSGPRAVRTRWGGTRTVGGGPELPPGLVGPLLALAAAGLFAHCAVVLRSFRRAVEAASLAGGDGRPDNVPDVDTRPWHQHKASDARPDHLRRGDDPPRPA